MDKGTRVFLIAANRLLREALTRILNKRNDISVVGALAYSAQVLEQIASCDPDVLLLDPVPVPLSDLPFIREVRERASDIKVVMIGMDDDEEVFLTAVAAGAVGYVLKDASAMDVVAAVRAVMNGEAVCPPRLCLSLFKYLAQQWTQKPNIRVRLQFGLSRREQQLIPLIGQGLTNKEIASQLNLSEQTVKNHIHRMLQKVGVADRLSAVELVRAPGGLPVHLRTHPK